MAAAALRRPGWFAQAGDVGHERHGWFSPAPEADEDTLTGAGPALSSYEVKWKPASLRLLDRVWRPAMLCAAVILAARVALVSTLNQHPDEAYHVNAMTWFYFHPGVPALDTDGLLYSPDGWSRVWTGELVYPLVGRAAALWHHLTGIQPPLVVTRLFNTALLFPLLIPLLWGRSRLFDLPAVGAFMAGVPQLIYLFGYANSDAWAILVSTLLLLSALRCLEGGWRLDWPLLGTISALVLMAKANAWFVVPVAWTLAWIGWRAGLGRPWLRLAGAAILAAGLAAPVLLAPRLTEPGNWAEAVHAQKVRRSWQGFHPDHPAYVSFRLRDRGVPLTRVAGDPTWYRLTFLSSWATFGYMNTVPPDAAWTIERLALVGLLVSTILALRARGQDGPRRRKRWLIVLCAAATFAVLLGASIAHSWIEDNQAQGRYLLPGVFLYAIALIGVRAQAAGRARRIQLGLLALHVVLGLAVAAYLGGHIAPPPSR